MQILRTDGLYQAPLKITNDEASVCMAAKVNFQSRRKPAKVKLAVLRNEESSLRQIVFLGRLPEASRQGAIFSNGHTAAGLPRKSSVATRLSDTGATPF